MKRQLLTAIILGACVACGGGSYGGPAPATPAAPATPSSGTGPVTITIVGVRGQQSFSPNPATVPAGQMVIWRNADTVIHRVRLKDGSIDTGDIAPGASTQPLPLGAVSKPYSCSLHPNMVGSLNDADTDPAPPCTGYCG